MTVAQKARKRTSTVPPPSGVRPLRLRETTLLSAVDELDNLGDELLTCSLAFSTLNDSGILDSIIVSLDRVNERLRKVRRDIDGVR